MRRATVAERSAVPVLVLVTLFVLVVVPILMVVYTAFRDAVPFSGSESHFTLSNFGALFEEKTVSAAINTVIVTIGGTLMATAIGCILAWLAARTDIPFKPLVHVVGILPLFISMLAATVTWALLGAGNSAYLNIILADLGAPFRIEMRSLAGFIFVEGLYHVPYPFLLVYAALSLITSDIEEAAAVHGANQFQTTMKIIFPVVLPAILGSMILNAVMMVENIAVPQILGGPVGLETLSIRVYYLMNRIPSSPTQASAVALLLAAIVFALIYAQNFVLKGRDYRTISGKGAQQKVMSLGNWRYVAAGFVVLYFTVAIVLPMLALLLGALRANAYIANTAAMFDVAQLSSDRLLSITSDSEVINGLKNSLVVAFVTCVFGTGFFFILAYIVHRTRIPGRKVIEYIAMMPLAIPATLLAMGVLWAWIGSPIPVYGTIYIIILSFLPRFMPQAFRALSSSVMQVHEDLENAALLCGATRAQTVWKVFLPLVRGGVVSAAFLLFVLSLREVGGALFLYTTNTRVLSIVVFESYENGSWDFVAGVSLLYTVLLGGITLLGLKWLRPSL